MAIQRPPARTPQVRPPAQEPPIPASPIHPLAALVTIVLDQVWGIPETVLLFSGIGMLAEPLLIMLIGGMALAAVFLIQRYIANDSFKSAFAKAFAMAILAGVPWMLGGTLVGSLLIGWSGLSKISGWLKG